MSSEDFEVVLVAVQCTCGLSWCLYCRAREALSRIEARLREAERKAITDEEAEADIQQSFQSNPYPADDDADGWASRSAKWQAAWAGCYKRAAQTARERDRAQAERDRLADEVERLRGVCEAFAVTAEDAVRHHENKDKGGQKVPFHGDFSHVPPSTVGRLRWWAREFRAALADTAPTKGEGAEPPCGGSRCFRAEDGTWIHSSKSYSTCSVRSEEGGT